MKKVLFVTYIFPPFDCECCRQIKIAKYLPDYGWIPLILTVDFCKFLELREYNPPFQLSELTKIVYAKGNNKKKRPWGSNFISRLINSKFMIPDVYVGWIPCAYKTGLRMIRNERIDAIMSSSKPETNHLVAYFLKKKSKLPWIADFRDPWIENSYREYPMKSLKHIDKYLEKTIVNNADLISTVTESLSNDIRMRYPLMHSKKITTVTHGFDPYDFNQNGGTEICCQDKFTIAYAGVFYGLRSPDMFLMSIREIIDQNGRIKKDLLIQFVGANVEKMMEMVKKLNLCDNVIVWPFTPHRKLIHLMKSATVLLLVNGTSHLDEINLPRKIFDYLALKKPILALSPEGEISRLIRSANHGIVVSPDNKEGIKNAILKLYDMYFVNRSVFQPVKDYVSKYDVRLSVKEIAGALNRIVK